jgi:hypothetical protein
MKGATLSVLMLCSTCAFADPPAPFAEYSAFADHPTPSAEYSADDPLLDEQKFMREYIFGVHRHRIPGGRLYGWKLNDRWTFGRFKGENDEVGFGLELNQRDRLEFTTGGLRWRRAIGGPSND